MVMRKNMFYYCVAVHTVMVILWGVSHCSTPCDNKEKLTKHLGGFSRNPLRSQVTIGKLLETLRRDTLVIR